METDNRPNAALINREWYESAKGVLSARDLSCVLVAAVEYVLYGDTAIRLEDSARVVFAMVRPALDSDITKYRERCNRNAANARSGRQRVAASGSEWQPVAANTTPTPTPTTTTTSTTTLSLTDGEQRKRDRFVISGYFWSVGSNSPIAEMETFWDYYEALGWKNNKGAAIVSKLAAARMWRRQYDTSAPPEGSSVWFKVVSACPILDMNVFRCFAGAEYQPEKVIVHLKCAETFLQQLTECLPNIKGDLQAIWRGREVILDPAR